MPWWIVLPLGILSTFVGLVAGIHLTYTVIRDMFFPRGK